MFTGIVTDVGAVEAVETRPGGDARLTLGTRYDLAATAIGASIACDGVCLTLTTKDPAAGRFTVDVSGETLSKTTIGDWTVGRRVNLEKSLRLGDELGGHIVSGHVDGVAKLTALAPDGDSTRWTVSVDRALAPFIAAKGSVALDGCSLTVNSIEDARDRAAFTINLIPHTKAETTFGDAAVGRRLNLEVDMLARYVARLETARRPAA